MQPDDLIKYGLIPEFIGRVPVVVGLNSLDENALIQILSQPKNALIKQYKKLFSYDGVEILFEDDALLTVAQKAIKLKTGARGLRTIMEDAMLDIMYEVPGNDNVQKVIITKEVIEKKEKPKIIYKETA